MTALDLTLGGDGTLFVGEDKTCTLRVPDDMTTWSIQFVVRRRDNSVDAVFDKTATVVGTYHVDPALNTQRAEVQLTDTELSTVKARTYRHSWKRTDDQGETVLAWGDFIVEQATAR